MTLVAITGTLLSPMAGNALFMISLHEASARAIVVLGKFEVFLPVTIPAPNTRTAFLQFVGIKGIFTIFDTMVTFQAVKSFYVLAMGKVDGRLFLLGVNLVIVHQDFVRLGKGL